MDERSNKIRIFLVDDHGIVKAGIKSILEKESNYLVVGEATSADELLFDLDKVKIDLLISDITLEGMSGIELTKVVKKRTEGAVKVLIVSMHANDFYINQAFEAGANGYLLKDFEKNELFSAIDKIMKNEVFVSKAVSKIITDNYISNNFNRNTTVKTTLTKREIEIVSLISRGYSNKEIAEKILVSVSTVDAHRYNILRKLEVKNTAELIMKALKMKIIKPD